MPFDNAPQRELTTDEKNELDVLTRARALIENPRDWCNHAPESSVTAPYCAMTACYAATFMRAVSFPFTPAYEGVLYRLGRELPRPQFYAGLGVADFNDHPDTTHAAVLDLYDRAIAKLLVP